MRRSRRGAVAAALLTAAATFSLARAGEVLEEVVAKVNDDVITRSELEEREQQVLAELYRAYTGPELDSKVADINNAGTGGFAGSITCALFLQRFVTAARTWLHFDIYAWVPSTRPGRPEGGECQAARALYAWLTARYGG